MGGELMGDLLLRRRNMMQSTQAVDPFSLYATDGLILWLDGIKNTANGHDANAAYWEDLSGNGHDYLYNAQNIKNDKYLAVNGKGSSLRNAFSYNEINAIKQGTVEIVYDVAGTGTDARPVLTLGNVNNTTSRKNGSILFRAGTSNKSIAITTGIHTYSSEMYKDGVAATNSNVTVSWSTTYSGQLFMYNTYNFTGNVYALRVYGRVLSEAEIIQNFKADKIRFGIS